MFSVVFGDGRVLLIEADSMVDHENYSGFFLLKKGRRVAYIPEGYIIYEETIVQ